MLLIKGGNFMLENLKGKYWFGFRQTYPTPPGSVVVCGPYDSYEEAKIEREKAKAWDCSVSIPFTANSKEEAFKIAEKWTSCM
jgi:hypothetical protein